MTTLLETGPIMDGRELYLDLMKRTLTRLGFGDCLVPYEPRRRRFSGRVRHALVMPIQRLLARNKLVVARQVHVDPEAREAGRVWPPDAETMVGRARIDNIQHCVSTVIEDGVPGDLIETGVWRGGSCIFMRAILAAYGDTERTVWVADSFQGLPKPNAEQFPDDAGDKLWSFKQLAIPLPEVQANFARYGLLDQQVKFIVGFFSDTLPTAPVERLAVLRLDGDMYESTIVALEHLYPKLQPGGFCIVDDYGAVAACKRAVHDYREQHGIDEPIETIDWTGVFWRKQA